MSDHYYDIDFEHLDLDQDESAIDDLMFGDHSFEEDVYTISQLDYNLNSPLTSHDADHFLKLIHNIERSEKREHNSLLKAARSAHFEWYPPDLHHRQMAHMLLEVDNYKIDQANRLLSDADQMAAKTHSVVGCFLREWIGFHVPYRNRVDLSLTTKGYLNILMELYHIVLLMNNFDIEPKALTFWGFRPLSIDSYMRTCKYPNLGTVYLTNTLCMFSRLRIIVDRNFVLMFKDIANSRFHSLSSMEIRNEDYIGDWKALLAIYKSGDRVVLETGNSAYDIIGMLESAMNEQYCRLASRERPLIPVFPNFSLYMDENEKEAFELHKECGNFIKLIRSPTLDRETVTAVYGSFRHWGHPYIQVDKGLDNLRKRTQLKRQVDEVYAKSLASDLAKRVLMSKWKSTRKWFVNHLLLPDKHPLLPYFSSNQMPTPKVIEDFGDKWHELPLMKCFDIPDVIDPSIIYSDKSHSMTLSELKKHLSTGKQTRSIPSHKVIKTFMENPATNWPEFISEVSIKGFSEDDLVIALREKERELKIEGRFFALMSWKLREYFVITEYLIKEHFVPLFRGLTMADDLQTVMKKMLENTQGQGQLSYESITISNHIDYSKWCNSQSKESTWHIFDVMDRFLGVKNLISRTHDIFQNSFFYYKGAGLSLTVQGDKIIDRSGKSHAWYGQNGGLEGLRQKGWSILSLLCIEREKQIRNTSVRVLAQGDNQVVCTFYKLPPSLSDNEIKTRLKDITDNNQVIMDNIFKKIELLGMTVNRAETMQSADYLNYGKIPIFRGVFLCLETKRWSRMACTTNDQIPSLASILSTVSSNSLTVAHQSNNPINAMCHYNWAAVLTLLMLEKFDPALRGGFETMESKISKLVFFVRTLYADPSIGGAGGLSLTRYLVRSFPDPITESLSFFKFVGERTTDPELRQTFLDLGFPRHSTRVSVQSLYKLLERPSGLNLPSGLSAANIVKEAVRNRLINDRGHIKNEILRNAIQYQKSEGEALILWLSSVKPWFPRFMSEVHSASFSGIMESIVGLVQNSRTLKSAFSKTFGLRVAKLMVLSEHITLTSLRKPSGFYSGFWKCSNLHAQRLRDDSWKTRIVGQTVPHPIEMLIPRSLMHQECHECNVRPDNSYITSCAPAGIPHPMMSRGPYRPYLGSQTSEQTSIIQPWEKATKIPVIKRATKLLNSIGWITKEEGTVAETLMNMVKSLTGELPGNYRKSLRRTGCATHRFASSRQSSGGFISQSPIPGTYLVTTSDSFSDMAQDNYTFMFQPLLLFAQMHAAITMRNTSTTVTTHYHIRCNSCVTIAEDYELEAPRSLNFPDVSNVLEKWKPSHVNWYDSKPLIQLKEISFLTVSPKQGSYLIGLCSGFAQGEEILTDDPDLGKMNLYPITIKDKLIGDNYIQGYLKGLYLVSSSHVMYRKKAKAGADIRALLTSNMRFLIDKASKIPEFIILMSAGSFVEDMTYYRTGVNPSFPSGSRYDSVVICQYLWNKFEVMGKTSLKINHSVLIPGDFQSNKFYGLLGISLEIHKIISASDHIEKDKVEKLKTLLVLASRIRVEEVEDKDISFLFPMMKILDAEVRLICKERIGTQIVEPKMEDQANINVSGSGWAVKLETLSVIPSMKYPSANRLQCPLISAMRFNQFPTGSYYKLATLIRDLNIRYRDFICMGDGSGGLTSALLSLSKGSRGIFNTLIDLTDVNLKGTEPGVPHIFTVLGPLHQKRCVNLKRMWENPTDLRKRETWDHFSTLISEHHLDITLLLCDAESNSLQDYEQIWDQLTSWFDPARMKNCTIILKVYYNHLVESVKLKPLYKHFGSVSVYQSKWASSHSSELYVVMKNPYMTPSLKGELSDESLKKIMRHCYAFKTYTEELHRALDLWKYNQSLFLNPRFQVSSTGELMRELNSVGVKVGIIYEWMNDSAMKTHSISATLAYFTLFLNSVISVTEGAIVKKVPSDQACIKWMLVMTALRYFMSLVLKDEIQYKKVLISSNKAVSLNITHSKYSASNADYYMTNLSVSPSNRGITKTISLRSFQSKLGRLLRSLLRFYSSYKTSSIYEKTVVDEILKKHRSKRSNKFITILFEDWITHEIGDLHWDDAMEEHNDNDEDLTIERLNENEENSRYQW